jgi:hypothetical protein
MGLIETATEGTIDSDYEKEKESPKTEVQEV